MQVELTRESDHADTDFPALLEEMRKIEDGHREQIYNSGYPEEETHGHYSHEPYDRAKLIFSKTPISCTVTIEGRGQETQQLQLTEGWIFDLPVYEARYTVCAVFIERGGEMVEAIYSFDLGDA